MKRLLAVIVLVLTTTVLNGGHVAALPPGLTVVPAIKQIALPNGSTPVRFTAQLTNTTAQSMTLALSAEDFTYLNQNGSIRFLRPDTTLTSEHGLAEAIRFDHELVVLQPGVTTNVSLTIIHPDQLAPGGHYAAILYRQVDATSLHGISIGLKPAVATLLFVTTNGQGSAGLSLASPVVRGIATDIPASVDLVFTDTGNTQTSVHGLVQVIAPSGDVMAQGVINVDSSLILPAAERLFSVPLELLGSRPWWPGSYQLKVQYKHDGQTNYTQYRETFTYIDGRILLALGAIMIVGVIVLLRRFGPGTLYLVRR